MFGYVRPVKAELRVREYDFYRATYCGICRAMKAHTGLVSNVTLTYDSVFLALVRMLYIDGGDIGARMRRCVAHPLKKRPILDENEAVVYTARAFAILTYYKMRDDAHDEGGLRRLAVGAAMPIAHHAVSLSNIPELEEIVKRKLDEIEALERAKCNSVDAPAALFGELLGEIFSFGLEGDGRLVTYECGSALGRFIYAADAAEDYYKDRESGSYNPYVISYGGADLTEENRASVKCALILECKRLEAAVNLLPFENRETIESILRNVIYLGLVERIAFLDGDYSDKESRGKGKHENRRGASCGGKCRSKHSGKCESDCKSGEKRENERENGCAGGEKCKCEGGQRVRRQMRNRLCNRRK